MPIKPVTVLVFDDDDTAFRALVNTIHNTRLVDEVVFLWSPDGKEVCNDDGSNTRILSDMDLTEEKADVIFVDLKMKPHTAEYDGYGGLKILERIFAIPYHCRSVVANTVHKKQIDRQTPTVREALRKFQKEDELIVLDMNAPRSREFTLLRQIIASRSGRRLLSPQVERQILFLGRINEPILMLGEAGSGKEGIAASVHAAWQEHVHKGAKRPFVSLNAGALQYDLLRSELFGYAPGAYSGAAKEGAVGAAFRACGIKSWSDVQGKTELHESQEHYGTLFLDEVGNMPLDCQGLLLRFLENPYAAAPLGHPEIQKVKPRIIAATNNPEWFELARSGRTGQTVRPDLFDRLARHVLFVPSLTINDVRGFVRIIGEQHWEPEAIEHLITLVESGQIRGNVRGLVNFIKRTDQVVGLGDDIGWSFDSVTCEAVDLSLRLSIIPRTSAIRSSEDKVSTFITPKGNVATIEQIEAALQYAIDCEEGPDSRVKDAPGTLVTKYCETSSELILLMWFVIYSESRRPQRQKLEEFRNNGAMLWFISSSDQLAHRSVQKTAKAIMGLQSTKEIGARAKALHNFCVANGLWPQQLQYAETK